MSWDGLLWKAPKGVNDPFSFFPTTCRSPRPEARRARLRAGIESHTHYNPADPGYLTYEGQGYTYFGSGHYVGTHRMGRSERDSVVDSKSRCHEHENLFLVGCGSMPTIATSNPTLTMAALSFMAADAILEKDLT